MLSCGLVHVYSCSGYVICGSMILYGCELHVQCLVGLVFFYHFLCSVDTLRVSSHVHWGLLFTYRVVNRRVGVFDVVRLVQLMINAVVGCSGSLASALRCLRDVLIAPLWVVLALSASRSPSILSLVVREV